MSTPAPEETWTFTLAGFLRVSMGMGMVRLHYSLASEGALIRVRRPCSSSMRRSARFPMACEWVTTGVSRRSPHHVLYWRYSPRSSWQGTRGEIGPENQESGKNLSAQSLHGRKDREP